MLEAMGKETTVLGEYVRARRKARGWTQEQLAERANVDQTFISQVETGRVTQPSFTYFRRLAEGLDVPVNELMAVAGLLEEPAGDDETSEVRQLIAYIERDPELGAQLAEIRARVTIDVYERVVRELVEGWKSQLRLLLATQPPATNERQRR